MAIEDTKDSSITIVTDTHESIETIVELAIAMINRAEREWSNVEPPQSATYSFDRFGGTSYSFSAALSAPQFRTRGVHRAWLTSQLEQFEVLNAHGLNFNADGTSSGLMITVKVA